MDDFIEDSYLDPTAENGSHNTSQNASISAQSPSSFFTIDSDSDNETEEWIDVKHKSAELLTGGTFIDELRSAIDDTDCDPGIIRKILGGRSITRDIEDATQIRQIVWPALLGVAKREMKEIKEDSEYDQSLKNHFENVGISIKSIPV